MIETGKILQKRYRIEKQIGQGGMGAVYLATDQRFNSTVAIKGTLLPDEKYLKAFKREARLLNSLKHSALPKVTDFFIEDNGQYIVMEYIPGDDLFETMEKSGKAFSIEDVMNWTEQLLEALEYLHNQDDPVIHRDIKPQNLKLTSDGKVILLDFGLAKGNPTDANHQTAANSIFGYSRNYASLEQIQGTGTDPRSDLYSLAATIYHLATGKAPADALTRVMMVMNEEEDPLLPAHLIHDQIPETFSAVLENAMSLNANQRPQEAIEMRKMLSGEEVTEVSVKRSTAPNTNVDTDLLTQNTKLIPDKETAAPLKQSDIKTEVLSEQQIAEASVQTKLVRPQTLVGGKQDTDENAKVAPPTTQSSLGGKLGGAIAALGILAIVGTAASIVYFWNPSTTTANPVENSAFESNKPLLETTAEISNTDTELENANTNVEEEPVKLVEVPLEESPEKRVEPKSSKPSEVATKTETKPKEKSKGVNKNKVAVGGDGKLVISEGEIITPDGLKITKDGKIITKDGRVIGKTKVENRSNPFDPKSKNSDARKVRPPRPVLPKGFPMSREQYDKLSPAQKRQVRRALDIQRREALKRMRENKRKNNKPPKRPFPPPRKN